jgi:hypothetical protein
MAKKENDFLDELREQGERRARRRVKSKLKKLHTATKVLAVLCLLVGLAAGYFVCELMSKNDRFVLVGETAFSIDVGEPYTYTEQGVEAVCFGRDVSGKLVVETSLEKDANGNYIIPTDEEGVYTITYTVSDSIFTAKFNKGENGVIKRIRTFTVNAAEEDGRNG